MIKSRNLSANLLDNLQISRVTNTQEQLKILNNLPSHDFSLLIIDNIADLFAFEFAKREYLIEKNNNFANFMIKLSKIALLQNIPIIITNQILQNDDNKYHRMYMQLENHVHQKIQLEKIKNNFSCTISSPFINETKFNYKITNSGIEET